MTRAQKRAAIERELIDNPNATQRQIAKKLDCAPITVARVWQKQTREFRAAQVAKASKALPMGDKIESIEPAKVEPAAEHWQLNSSGQTAKQIAVLKAFEKHPRKPEEKQCVWYKRLATVAGVSASYVQHVFGSERDKRIGAEIRAKEEAAEKSKMVPAVPFDNMAMGPVRNFVSWQDTFGKLKLLSEMLINLARERGDVYAEAFCKDIRDVAERAVCRAYKARKFSPYSKPDVALLES